MRLLLLLPIVVLVAAGPAPTVAPAPLDKRAVLTALARLSEAKIPKDKLHCEINGTVDKKDGSYVYNDIQVRDLFVKYVIWGQQDSAAKVQDLTCEGSGKQSCRWWFGEKENTQNPGWSIVLNFTYDQKGGTVPKTSLECIQIP